MKRMTWGGYRQGFTVTTRDRRLSRFWEDVEDFYAFSLWKEEGEWTMKIWVRPRGACKERLYATVPCPRNMVREILLELRAQRNTHREQSKAFSLRISRAMENMTWEATSKMSQGLKALQEKDNLSLEGEKWSVWGRKD